MATRKYPRPGQFEPAHPGRGGRCVGCWSTTGDVGRLHVQVNHFRGDDLVIKCCRGCYINTDLQILIERSLAPGLAFALDSVVAELAKLRAAAMAVSTDLAQDCLEDPCGWNEREKTGYRRLAVAAAEKLKEALA